VNGLADWAARTRVAGEYATNAIAKLNAPAARHPQSRKSHFHLLAQILATFLPKCQPNIRISFPRLAAADVQANHGLIQITSFETMDRLAQRRRSEGLNSGHGTFRVDYANSYSDDGLQ
jgi:hypothetical protein